MADPTPCEQLKAAKDQLAALLSGKSVRVVETPQLGRVEFSLAHVGDLHRLIASLQRECDDYLGNVRTSRGPISVEVGP